MISQLTSVPAATLDQVGRRADGGETDLDQRRRADQRRQAGGALHRRRVLPLLRGRAVGGDRRAQPVRQLQRARPIRSAAETARGNAEPYPLTPTWTFAKPAYTSNYLTFTPVEGYTNIPDKSTGFYTPLQTPTAAQVALLNKYDAAQQGAIPFIDYGNKFVSIGASYNPAVLSGLTWAQIANDLHNPTSPVAQAVLGVANYSTAAVCALTHDQPASACTAVVRGLQSKI